MAKPATQLRKERTEKSPVTRRLWVIWRMTFFWIDGVEARLVWAARKRKEHMLTNLYCILA